MKNKAIYLLPLLLLLSISSKAEIEFFKGTWKEAVAKATSAKKPILVDFYTTWCGPCKYMSKKVFTDEEVSKFYNDNFICVKIDAESQEEELVSAMRLEGYPTIGYFESNGKLLYNNVGVMEKEDLLTAGKKVINFRKNEVSISKNNYSTEVLSDYLSILKYIDPTKAKTLADSHLKKLSEADLGKKENWSIISNFAANYNTREFKYIAENPEKFIQYGDAYSQYYKEGIKSLMIDAVQQKDYSKIELHKKYHIKTYKALNLIKLPEEYYETVIDIMYYDGINDNDKFYSSTTNWLDKYNMANAQVLCEYSLKLAEKITDAEKIKQLKKYAEKALELNNNDISNYTISYISLKSGNRADAIKYAKVAQEKCKDAQILQFIEEYLHSISAE